MGLFRKSNKQKEQEKQEIASNISIAKVFKYVGEDLATEIATFEIKENFDNTNSIIAVNEKNRFREDLNFSKDRLYDIVEYSLGITNKTNKEKAGVLSEKIKTQEDFLKRFDNEPELNGQYNYRDESFKLKQLKVLYDHCKLERKGNYMRLNNKGQKVFEFVLEDGIFFPYFFGSRGYRVHPDKTAKKKIWSSENIIMNSQMNWGNKFMNWSMVILLGILVFGVIVCSFWSYKLYIADRDMNLKINGAGIVCNNAMSTLVTNYGGIVNDYIDLKKKELEQSESNINQQDNNNIINMEPNQK